MTPRFITNDNNNLQQHHHQKNEPSPPPRGRVLDDRLRRVAARERALAARRRDGRARVVAERARLVHEQLAGHAGDDDAHRRVPMPPHAARHRRDADDGALGLRVRLEPHQRARLVHGRVGAGYEQGPPPLRHRDARRGIARLHSSDETRHGAPATTTQGAATCTARGRASGHGGPVLRYFWAKNSTVFFPPWHARRGSETQP